MFTVEPDSLRVSFPPMPLDKAAEIIMRLADLDFRALEFTVYINPDNVAYALGESGESHD